MLNPTKKLIHRLLRRCLKIDIMRVRSSSPAVADARRLDANARRFLMMNRYAVDLVLDVGANTGQYARRLRRSGYQGEIISFEPLSQAFLDLDSSARHDGKWEAVNIALGDTTGDVPLNVSSRTTQSSFLAIDDAVGAKGLAEFVGSEVVAVKRLDDLGILARFPGRKLLLKIDVQGYELEVLRGAVRALPQTQLIECELSLVERYKGQPSYVQVVEWLREHGFRLISLDNGVTDRDLGETIKVDGIFVGRC